MWLAVWSLAEWWLVVWWLVVWWLAALYLVVSCRWVWCSAADCWEALRLPEELLMMLLGWRYRHTQSWQS